MANGKWVNVINYDWDYGQKFKGFWSFQGLSIKIINRIRVNVVKSVKKQTSCRFFSHQLKLNIKKIAHHFFLR